MNKAENHIDVAELNNAGIKAYKKGNFEKSLEYYYEALSGIEQVYTQILYNVALSHMELKNYDKALECLGNTKPSWEIAWHQALCYLHKGDWKTGIDLYSSRYMRTAPDAVVFPNLPIPRCIELKDMLNKNVLVLNEQGFGDEFMFSRAFFPADKFCSKSLLIQVYPENLELMRAAFPNLHFFAERSFDIDFIKKFDCYTCTGDLFKFLSQDTMVLPIIFNIENNEKIANSIGICYGANPKSKAGAARSIPREYLEKIRDPNKTYISLQKDNQNPNLTWVDNSFINNCTNFLDTAKLMLKMEEIVTCDSAIAHLAGCLNLKTTLLINKHLCWRWQYNPYPTVTLVNING